MYVSFKTTERILNYLGFILRLSIGVEENVLKKTNESKETDQEVDRYFAKLTPDQLRVKGRRNPEKCPRGSTLLRLH
jgi:hypothetical protein